MRAPTVKSLTAAFRDLTPESAKLIRRIAHATNDGAALAQIINSDYRCKETERYVAQMYSSPYDSQIWRVTVALHAIDQLLGTSGVEALGPGRSGDYAPPYEYCNAGDPYAATLIYKRDTDNLFIGNWDGIAEQHPNWGREGVRALVYTLNAHGANQAFVDEGCLAPVGVAKGGK